MISFSPLQEKPVQNLFQLEEGLKKHLENLKACDVFFNNCKSRKLKLTDETTLSAGDYYSNSGVFTNTYNKIFDRSVEKWEKEYEQLQQETALLESMKTLAVEEINENTVSNLNKSEEGSSKLVEIKAKIDECKKANEVFGKNIIELFRKSPGTLMYKDALLFLPTQGGHSGTIGECHCSESLMGRSSREGFSSVLSSQISDVFSDKTKPLTIASIGAGLCFHELEIHALVTHAGYKIENWVIVDPIIVPKTIANFETILQWENRDVKVITVNKQSSEYFAKIETNPNVPDVCLFIDVDLHIKSKEIFQYSKQMKNLCLFAEFQKDETDAMNFICANEKT